MYGLTGVRRLKRPEYCAVIDHASFATPKLSRRRIFGSQEPIIEIDQISTKDLRESLDKIFTKQRNIIFDPYTFLNRKQLNGESVEKFYGCLRKLSLNCELGSHEESIIRDVFITRWRNSESATERNKIG